MIPTGTQLNGLIPPLVFVLDLPTRPEDISKRHHNRIVKDAARRMMERHHDENIPKHFKRDARRRYGYAPRNPKYTRWKQRKYGTGGLDMVKRGRTRQWMTSAYKLRMGGNAEAGTLKAQLILTFPFKGGSGRLRQPGGRGGIVIQQLIKEMQRFANDEPALLAGWFQEEYMRGVEQFRGNRKRVRKGG